MWGWDRLCGSKVGGKGSGLILPTGEGREEKPGGPRVYNSYTFMAPCLSRSVLGFGSLKDLGKFSLFRQGVVVCFFFPPLHPCGFEAQQSAGMWLAGGFGVSRGCSPLLDAEGGAPTSFSRATLGLSSTPKVPPLPPWRHLPLLEART